MRETKRSEMLGHALDAFVANGYVGTSTDQLAAAASISKQTLYKEFGDKEGVFVAVIRAACERIHEPFTQLLDDMHDAPSARDAVRLLAEQFARSIMRPEIQDLRRLVIAEAARFPELGRLYWERGFEATLDALAGCFAVLDDRGLLDIPEPRMAAEHFSGMLLWIPSNRTMFHADAPGDLESTIDAGVDAFLRAHRP